MDLHRLNDTFAIAGVLAFSQHGQLVRASVTTAACTAEIYLHGAHLTAWQPAAGEPVLFLSERSAFASDKAIRGGVPIIFPWFGARTGERTDGPSHGFARTSAWQLAFAALAGDDLHLTLTLGPTEASRALGYDHFQLVYELVLGHELKMRLTVANQADAPLHFEEALHTYLHVGDATSARLRGLQDTEYLDKVDGFQRKRQTEGELQLVAETDRPYLNTAAAITLDDPALGRRTIVAKANSSSTVIWNPWSELSTRLADMPPEGWRSMICIETANVGENAIVLPPRSVHSMESRVAVESLE